MFSNLKFYFWYTMLKIFYRKMEEPSLIFSHLSKEANLEKTYLFLTKHKIKLWDINIIFKSEDHSKLLILVHNNFFEDKENTFQEINIKIANYNYENKLINFLEKSQPFFLLIILIVAISLPLLFNMNYMFFGNLLINYFIIFVISFRFRIQSILLNNNLLQKNLLSEVRFKRNTAIMKMNGLQKTVFLWLNFCSDSDLEFLEKKKAKLTFWLNAAIYPLILAILFEIVVRY